REARRVAREAAAAPGLAVRLLRRGEDARLEAPAGASLERAADARDVAHVDAQADDHRGPTLARATGVAGGGIAGRRLQLAERLAAFREQVALVDRVLDEVPGQQRIEGVGAVDEAARVHALAPAEGFQDGPPLLRALVQADQDRGRAPVAAREERLQVRLARALGLDLDAGDGPERAAEVGE